ncbi:MAG: ATP-binding protein [Thermoplasmata archaeon]|nr:ATP-binding protein [Thermoplasmata archaeon]
MTVNRGLQGVSTKGIQSNGPLNLDEEASFRAIFEQSDRTVDNIILSIHTLRQMKDLDPKNTLIFLDEIQACPEALSSLKSFRKDGRYSVVATGSMLGVMDGLIEDDRGSGLNDGPVSPMGDARQYRMTSMDFEEFLWANDIPQEAIDLVRDRIRTGTPIESPIYEKFSKLFRIYQITGGMPASVQAYIDDSTTFSNSSDELEDIIVQIRRDITKYNTPSNALRTAECFESIPYQLAETNKKFHYSRISPEGIGAKSARKAADRYMENILWMEHAGYGNFCHAVESFQCPLKENVKRDVFKIYLLDTGILTHMYGDKAINSIFTEDTGFNKGAITENSVAENLSKCGYEPAYYINNNGSGRMEIDFVVEFFDGLAAIEVKSGKDRSSPSIGKILDHHHVERRIMLEKGNVYRSEDGIEHYPLFAAAFFDVLDPRPEYI